MSYSGPEGRHGFDEAVLVQRPDRLRSNAVDVGSDSHRHRQRQEIVGYHPREGVMVRGQAQSESAALRKSVGLDEITSLLAGLPPVDGSGPWRQEGNSLMFAQRQSERLSRLRVAAAGADPVAAFQRQRRGGIDRAVFRLHHDGGRFISVEDQYRSAAAKEKVGNPFSRTGIERDDPSRLFFTTKAGPRAGDSHRDDRELSEDATPLATDRFPAYYYRLW